MPHDFHHCINQRTASHDRPSVASDSTMRLRTELLDDDEARIRFEADLREMETMVAQTLDFMRGLGGHEARSAVDVNALLQALQADQQAMGRSVVIEGQALLPFVGVPSLLRRALGNLVDNAVLYGGGATIRVEDTPEQLTLHVLDTGPGLPGADLERVFEPFFRMEASRSRTTGGTGLGLGIVRSIARLHGGDVRLRNRSAGGLDAALSLPRAGMGTTLGAMPGTRQTGSWSMAHACTAKRGVSARRRKQAVLPTVCWTTDAWPRLP